MTAPALPRARLLRVLASLELTVLLLFLAILLVFGGTLAQTRLGVWAVQHEIFHTWFVWAQLPGTSWTIPVFPGGFLVGGLLLANLAAAYRYRFAFVWRKAGLLLAHGGLILLLLGELFAGLWQEDFQLRLAQGETRNYAESFRHHELALIETSDPQFDDVTVVPAQLLARGAAVQHPALPFRIVPRQYHEHALLSLRREAPGAPPSPASAGFGPQLVVMPLPAPRSDEPPQPAAFVELIGPDGTLGTYLVSAMPGLPPQTVTVGPRVFTLSLRPARAYKPFSLQLLELRHDVYPGSEIPRNFSSRVRLHSADGQEDREALISMNHPLRYGGLTFYQYQMNEADGYSVLQVVRNPSWALPYVSCLLMALGLLVQFARSLARFIAARAAPAPRAAP